jgi:hypothetical protein
MQAIITKYIGPSNTRGSRIKASCSAGSITIGYPHEQSIQGAHAAAAMALVRKLGWQSYGDWQCGGVETGFVFVNTGAACGSDRYTSDFAEAII